jgi:acetylornithine deacetylase
MNVGGVLDRLAHLVAFDTQNPPRDLTAESPVYHWIIDVLGKGFEVSVTDHGLGRVSLLAVRGIPSMLFNVHLDTVPVISGSRFPALQLTRHNDRVYGRGACDIKGAMACLLEIAASTVQPMAMLFTSDEEGASGCCIREFIDSGQAGGFEQVVVAEPTRCQAVLSHRGYLSVKGEFFGIPGHSSEPRALHDNALHKLCAWVASATELARQMEHDGHRPCLNVGEVHGGIKSNVVADKARLHWSARLAPGSSNRDFLAAMTAQIHGGDAEWQVPFAGPPLPVDGNDILQSEKFVAKHGLETGPPVDFWTEASLFAETGTAAIVLGPGDIAQAHAVDEWVSIDQLARALEIYSRLVIGHD